MAVSSKFLELEGLAIPGLSRFLLFGLLIMKTKEQKAREAWERG